MTSIPFNNVDSLLWCRPKIFRSSYWLTAFRTKIFQGRSEQDDRKQQGGQGRRPRPYFWRNGKPALECGPWRNRISGKRHGTCNRRALRFVDVYLRSGRTQGHTRGPPRYPLAFASIRLVSSTGPVTPPRLRFRPKLSTAPLRAAETDFPWHKLDGRALVYASLGTLQ